MSQLIPVYQGATLIGHEVVGGPQPTTEQMTATSQTSSKVALPANPGKSTIAAVNPTPARNIALVNPSPSASTNSAGSVASFALYNAADTLSGSLSVAVGSGSAVVVSIPAGTTLASAATLLNGTSAFSSASLVASLSGSSLVITGPEGATGSATLNLTGTALVDATVAWSATWGVLGSNDGGNTFFPINIEPITTPGSLETTQTSTSNGLFLCDLAGLTHIEFVTSGTFAASALNLIVNVGELA